MAMQTRSSRTILTTEKKESYITQLIAKSHRLSRLLFIHNRALMIQSSHGKLHSKHGKEYTKVRLTCPEFFHLDRMRFESCAEFQRCSPTFWKQNKAEQKSDSNKDFSMHGLDFTRIHYLQSYL